MKLHVIKPWYVYIAQCIDTSLYTGISPDPNKRIATHNAGKGAKSIVKSKRPVKLVYVEKHPNRSMAAKREKAIKTWQRKYKLALIDSQRSRENKN